MMWDDLARDVLAVDADALSAGADEAAAYAVLDWLGCALAGARRLEDGSTSPPPSVPALLTVSPGGNGCENSVLCALIDDALAGLACDLDDMIGAAGSAIGSAVVPAALAAAQMASVSGREFLTAVSVGYEVASRLGNGHAVDKTGATEAAAAAAASARLLGLNQAATARALEMAASQPVAPPALSGLLAARRVTEGRAGRANWERSRRSGVITSALVGDAANGVALARRRVRIHAATPGLHAILDAALALKAAHRLHPEDIEAIEVHSPDPTLKGAVGEPDAAALERSLPFCLAMLFTAGRLGPGEMKPQYLLKAPVGWLMRGFSLVTAAGAERVVIQTRYGDRYEMDTGLPRGAHGNPLAPNEIRAKFHALADPTLGPAGANALADAVLALGAARDLSGLRASMTIDTHPPRRAHAR